MDLKIYFMFLLVVFLALLDRGQSLKCYWCNSANDKNCETVKNGTHLVNCDDHVHVLKPPGGQYTLCRKMAISLPGGEHRTVRNCGWEDHPKYDCYYTTTMDVKSTVCECFEDECNDSVTISASTGLTFCLLILASLLR